MIKFLKLKVFGKKSVVPKPMIEKDTSAGLNPIRSHSKSVGSAFTQVIPNRSVTVVRDKYTPPPKNKPFAYIPKGVCKDC